MNIIFNERGLKENLLLKYTVWVSIFVFCMCVKSTYSFVDHWTIEVISLAYVANGERFLKNNNDRKPEQK